MSYRIEAIELYVRETPPGRMLFLLGRKPEERVSDEERINPIGHVRLVLRNSEGNSTFGCSGDRLSVRWLDKRPGRDKGRKRRELVRLIETAREVYLSQREFESPFDLWHGCHAMVMQAGRKQDQEDLSSSFASALMERAVLDAVCRLEGKSIFDMIKADRLGIRLSNVRPELGTLELQDAIPDRPRTEFSIRHTVGLADPLTFDEVPPEERIDDGLPETLEQYIERDGVRHFKVKISGAPQVDFDRLERIWEVVVATEEPIVTLDANEAYQDLKSFAQLVERLERDLTGLFQHIEYIEQPLPRHMPHDQNAKRILKRIAERKPLIIDESDGNLEAFPAALELGYAGVSHKNCKGFLKSLLNHALAAHHAREGRDVFLSGEDLQNLPVVPLHQDFAALAVLGLSHCERNGHHYNFGLSMLSEKDKANAVKHHPDLYARRGDESFLKIRGGMVRCGSLQCPGFGVRDEPDWKSMTAMRRWLQQRHPA